MTDALRASLVAILFAPFAAGAQSRPDTTTEARIARVVASLRPNAVEVEGRGGGRETLAAMMARYHVPGVSIAVADGGRIAWARGFGVKEVGTRDSVTPTTLFQAASISKPVAATATLRLVQQGKLDLDADVNRYLVSWKVPENRFTEREKVTLRRIVSHSAGLTVHGFPGYAAGAPVPTVPQILDGVKPVVNTRPVRVDTFPGAIGRYSGGGVTVEQLVLTDVTGRPFPALLHDLVLAPAGMTHSTYEQPLPAAREREAAHAYDESGKEIPGRWHTYPEMAAAGLWTTPSDLLRWAITIGDARQGKSAVVLTREMATQMLTEQKAGYGLGPAVWGSGRAFRFGHGGANEGYRAQIVYFPETGQGVAVMTNGDMGGPLVEAVLRAVAAEYGWPALAPERVVAAALDSAALAGVVGNYDADFGAFGKAKARITRDASGRLTFVAPPIFDGEELVPISATEFVTGSSGFRVVMERDATGRATGFTISRENLSAHAVRAR